MIRPQVCIGSHDALGSTVRDGGVNFAVYSELATEVAVCLYDDAGNETACLSLPGDDHGIRHGFVSGIAAGQQYMLRASGTPELGFNAEARLLDPYATRLSGPPGAGRTSRCVVEEAHPAPRRWRAAPQPSFIYEAHVKGLTKRFPDLHETVRGTYAGLAAASVIAHLKSLGVSSVELLPVQAFVDEPHLQTKGLSNYWGYNPVAWFVPHMGYAQNPAHANEEFLAAVRALHDANIEVIVDVVFNHTAEGGADGPLWHLRGLGAPTYYVLEEGAYANHTGCGNSINAAHPAVQRLIIDCLRHWVQRYEVDGFRFDLATTLGRSAGGFDAQHPLLARIADDHVLHGKTLIAEPWDIGPGGYQLGSYAAPWAEWNDRYRDDVRAYWRGEPGAQAQLARRLHGSSELFERSGRGPQSCINFVAAHDGFVLQDLVSYSGKHNEANGEDNRDGHDHNLSDNCGHEGPTDDPEILLKRRARKRAMTATLLLSQGTPMWLAGDEIGNSQGGNNNAYCQDNDTSWIDWTGDAQELAPLIARLNRLRARSTVFQQHRFVHENVEAEVAVHWLREDGAAMQEADWHADDTPFAMHWQVGKERLCVCINRGTATAPFRLEPDQCWCVVLDTSTTNEATHTTVVGTIDVAPHSVLVLSNQETAA